MFGWANHDNAEVFKQSPYRFLTTPSSKSFQQTPTPSILTAKPPEQFASTPRFGGSKWATTVQQCDDSGIEDADSSPASPSRPDLSNSLAIKEGDDILDHDDNIFSPKRRIDVPSWTDQDDHSIAGQAKCEADEDSSMDELTNPMLRKRRRNQRKRKQAIEISSSPSPSSPGLLSEPEDFSHRQSSEPPSSPALQSPTTSKAPLLFRTKEALSPHADTVPWKNKPTFRLPPHRENSTTNKNLPDAFSPSRRRSKGKDYIAGGMADTLRSWIITLTAEDHGKRHRAQLNAPELYNRTLVVRHFRKDLNRHCTTVMTEDGSTVLLLGEGGSPGNQALHEGSRVSLHGGKMYWEIEAPGTGSQCNLKIGVSALWDVLEP
ncbi:MAG: hypothetical protein Q9160_001899 [Pyrenula sp. 1 TL-2023]